MGSNRVVRSADGLGLREFFGEEIFFQLLFEGQWVFDLSWRYRYNMVVFVFDGTC
jgi:hypothetical protein